MHRFGIWSIRVGVFVTVAGIVLGFGLMWFGSQDLAKPALMTIPIGFLLLFQGVVTVILYRPERRDVSSQRNGPPA